LPTRDKLRADFASAKAMNDVESLKDVQRVCLLAIRWLFEIIEQSSEAAVIADRMRGLSG
jgi:hypothetical protein